MESEKFERLVITFLIRFLFIYLGLMVEIGITSRIRLVTSYDVAPDKYYYYLIFFVIFVYFAIIYFFWSKGSKISKKVLGNLFDGKKRPLDMVKKINKKTFLLSILFGIGNAFLFLLILKLLEIWNAAYLFVVGIKMLFYFLIFHGVFLIPIIYNILNNMGNRVKKVRYFLFFLYIFF